MTSAVRAVFGGPLAYASLPWEAVEWSAFDFVGVDHYRAARIRDRYVEVLQPAFSHGKLVFVPGAGHMVQHAAPEIVDREIPPLQHVLEKILDLVQHEVEDGRAVHE